jgi:hypothetical protein
MHESEEVDREYLGETLQSSATWSITYDHEADAMTSTGELFQRLNAPVYSLLW